NSPWRVQIEKQGAKAVPVITVGPVINLEPPLGCANGGGARANASAVPLAGPAVCEAAMPTPMHQIRRFGEPNIAAPEDGAAGAMQGVVLTSNRLAENRTVLVMRRKNHSMMTDVPPISRA